MFDLNGLKNKITVIGIQRGQQSAGAHLRLLRTTRS
jgi:hypothetical protein